MWVSPGGSFSLNRRHGLLISASKQLPGPSPPPMPTTKTATQLPLYWGYSGRWAGKWGAQECGGPTASLHGVFGYRNPLRNKAVYSKNSARCYLKKVWDKKRPLGLSIKWQMTCQILTTTLQGPINSILQKCKHFLEMQRKQGTDTSCSDSRLMAYHK